MSPIRMKAFLMLLLAKGLRLVSLCQGTESGWKYLTSPSGLGPIGELVFHVYRNYIQLLNY